MNENVQVRIDVDAAKALAQWKALFAAEVFERAKRLAAQSSQPHAVTLSQYRQAAKIALQSLSAAIHEGGAPDAEPEAA